MFLTFIFLLCPIVAYAVVTPEYCAGFTPDTCKITAGCLYDDDIRECTQCHENKYCPANHNNQPQNCPQSSFPQSNKGSTSPEECFQSPITCKKADDSDDNQCRHYNNTTDPYRCGDNHDISAHMEGTQCYYNTRNCDKFGAPAGCDDGEITGGALWNNGQWNIQDCKCIQEGTQYQSCIASIEKTPTTTNQPSAQDSITYNISYYFCTGCPAGGYVNPDTDFQTNSKCFASDSSILVVCQCTNVERGYYGAGVNNIEYPISNTSAYSQSPYRNACPAGKTTNGPGATSANACEYTNQTKFCDAKGCFTLDNIDNWDFN